MKKAIGIILTAAILLSCTVPAFAMSQPEWNSYWADSEEIDNAVHVSVGSYESERSFTWYSETESECLVKLSRNADMSDSKAYYGGSTKTVQGDFVNTVSVKGLEPGCTYYYVCESEGFASTAAKVTVSDGSGFSAIHVSDVHMSGDSLDSEAMRDNAFTFDTVLNEAVEKSGAQLVLSSGDQASAGLRSEYAAFASSPVMKDMTMAVTVGNHDRKNIDYKYFAANPYKDYCGIKSYIGRDYWFVKDNVLFFMLDSNCPDAAAHRSFMQSAVRANPDVKWRVAVFHHDLFGGRIEHRESENQLLRLMFVPLMDEFKVDVALLGHSHYYTMSDIIYDGKAVTQTDDLSSVSDPQGTLYLVSGSATSPRTLEDGEVPPLGDKIGFDYLSDKGTYSILTFSENKLNINSYEVNSDEPFNSFSIEKTDADGGHRNTFGHVYNPFVRLISSIAAFFNNLDTAYKLYEKEGITINVFEAAFG